MVRSTPLAAFALVFIACNGGGDRWSGFSSGITTMPAGSSMGSEPASGTTMSVASASGEESTTLSAGSSGDSASSISIPDVGMIPDAGAGPPQGCKGKIDILFTISGSPTMQNQQEKLKASFPGFVATFENAFEYFDYHILSANTAGFWGYPSCEGCKDVCPALPEFPCGVMPETCDLIRGAGATYPIGENASNKRCELASGLRYVTAGEPDPEEAFTCIASMGTNGGAEVAEVTVNALADELNARGGCNEGFLRDDALLVVVAIQDTYDSFSAGTPKDWAAALIDAKGGDAEAVVLLVISTDVDDPIGLCGYEPSDEHELRTWTEIMQPNALFGSACATDYIAFFETAAAMIKSQCDVFVPQ